MGSLASRPSVPSPQPIVIQQAPLPTTISAIETPSAKTRCYRSPFRAD